MLEKPELQDERIIACVRDAYGVRIVHVTFLPLGADRNTAVYRVVAKEPPVVSNIVGTLLGGMLVGIIFWIGLLLNLIKVIQWIMLLITSYGRTMSIANIFI